MNRRLNGCTDRRCWRVRIFILLGSFSVLLSTVRAELAVTNYQTGSEVRHQVVLLRGTVEKGATQLDIINSSVAKEEPPVRAVIHENRFKALMRLHRGMNTLSLRSDKGGLPLTLKIRYQPQDNPYYVRLVWMTDSTGDTTFAAPNDEVPQDYAARLRTAGLLMQTFTAERMHDLGFGRITFRLERDKAGEVIVHTLKAPKTAEEFYALGDSTKYWSAVGKWLNREHPDPRAKNIVLAAFTRKDPETGKMKGHTALGGGNLGLFGSASVFSWPRDLDDAVTVFLDGTKVDATKVHDDSAGRGAHWALASTTIGATLHEMGHTFGLPHCTDGLCIMTRGFDRFNRVFTFHDPPSRRGLRGQKFTAKEEAYFAPISASFLQHNRWFHLDRTVYRDDARPKIEMDRDKGVVRVSSESGVPWVGLWSGDNIHAYREFKDRPDTVELKLDDIAKDLKGKPLSKVSAIGVNGRHAQTKVN